MNKHINCIILVFILLWGLPFVVRVSGAEKVFISTYINHSLYHSPEVGDTCWDEVTEYHQVEELGNGGYAKFANNGTHLFELFVVDSSLDWISVEFEAGEEDCMSDGHDGLTVYFNPNGIEVHDTYFEGATGVPNYESSNDLHFRYADNGDHRIVEITRPLNTSDPKDISFSDGDLVKLKFASSDMHFGSHEIYYLCVQTTGGEAIMPDIPETVNYNDLKPTILTGLMTGAAVFIAVHILVRQVFKPLSHPNAIVDKNFKRPTLKSRWHRTFGGEGGDSSIMRRHEVKI